MKPITFDPARLVVLARRRDEHRALARAAYDRYQNLREERTDVLRRASSTGLSGGLGSPISRQEAEENVAALHRQAEHLFRQMQAIEAESGEKSGLATTASALLKSAMKFAASQGLEIPAELAAEAHGDGAAHRPSFPGERA